MPAHEIEVEEAEEEGVLMRWLSTIKRAEEGKLVLEQMELDETGFPQPTGELEELEADSLVLALVRSATCRWSRGFRTSRFRRRGQRGPEPDDRPSGVFAGGDMVPAERSVTVAIGHGKKAARNIDAWLRDSAYEPPPKHEIASSRASTLGTTRRAPRTHRPRLDVVRRHSTFEEVVQASTSRMPCSRRAAACRRSRFSCDNCYGVCPDNAVLKLGDPGERYAIDYDFCKGCGICVAECPCGSIEMVPEEI